jgi:hypothetical protein
MVSEEYVSYETAKLLKEKGFKPDFGSSYWNVDKEGVRYSVKPFNAYTSDISDKTRYYLPEDSYPCPTQQLAMRWIREEHSIMIEVLLEGNGDGYYTHIKNTSSGETINVLTTVYYYCEQAIEAAIKYCLSLI